MSIKLLLRFALAPILALAMPLLAQAQLCQRMVVYQSEVTIGADGSYVDAFCIDYTRRTPSWGHRDKKSDKKWYDGFTGVSGDAEPVVYRGDVRVCTLAQALHGTAQMPAILRVRGAGSFARLRIERVDPNDNATYTIRFNGPTIFGQNQDDAANGRDLARALTRLRELAAAHRPNLDVQRAFWAATHSEEIPATERATNPESIERVFNRYFRR